MPERAWRAGFRRIRATGPVATEIAQAAPILAHVRVADTFDHRKSSQLRYIVNPPDYTGDVLVCRRPETDAALAELKAKFADRAFYEFDPASFRLTPLH